MINVGESDEIIRLYVEEEKTIEFIAKLFHKGTRAIKNILVSNNIIIRRQLIDIVGKKFGRWTVLGISDTKGYNGEAEYNCICDCGNVRTVEWRSLRDGCSKSCGCFRSEYSSYKFKNPDRIHAILKTAYVTLKSRHNKISNDEIIDFNLFKELSFSECYYCGERFSKILKDRRDPSHRQKFVSDYVVKVNGIDRLNNQLGYIYGNVVTCCTRCNTSKHVMDENEFLSWIKKVYEYNQDKIKNI